MSGPFPASGRRTAPPEAACEGRPPPGPMRAVLALSVAVGTLVACGDPAREAPPTVDVRGVFVRSIYDGQAAVLDHEAVGDRMPAMQMEMRVADPSVFEGVGPGTPVRVALDSASLTTIWSAEPLPPETALDLYDPEADVSASGFVAPE